MERILTHYLASDEDPDHWVELYYVTADERGRYFFGFEAIEIPASDIGRRVGAGELIRVGASWPITKDQELWKTPYGDVWLTSGADPVDDPGRILIERGAEPSTMSKHEIIFRRESPGELVYIPDEYLSGDTYTAFTEAVAEQLAKQLNARVMPQHGIIARWDVLASIIEEGAVDFAGLAYFLHPSRAAVHGVVPFANLDSFTLYFNSKSTSIGYASNPLLDPTLSVQERIIAGLEKNVALTFGVLDRTAATLEIVHVFRDHGLHWIGERGLTVESNVVSLKNWLKAEPKNRAIICDHNFAEQLDAAESAQEIFPQRYEHSTPRTSLPFKQPLPVGFVYPQRDKRWESALTKATADVMANIVFQGDYYDRLADEIFDKLRVKLLQRDELRNKLRMPELVTGYRNTGRAV